MCELALGLSINLFDLIQPPDSIWREDPRADQNPQIGRVWVW